VDSFIDNNPLLREHWLGRLCLNPFTALPFDHSKREGFVLLIGLCLECVCVEITLRNFSDTPCWERGLVEKASNWHDASLNDDHKGHTDGVSRRICSDQAIFVFVSVKENERHGSGAHLVDLVMKSRQYP
jgi:hypothetical protein